MYNVSVPLITLSELPEKHRIEDIYLYSLDVEGYEVQILKGLTLDHHYPGFMLINLRSNNDVEPIIEHRHEHFAVLYSKGLDSDMLYRKRHK